MATRIAPVSTSEESNDELAQKISQLQVCLERGLFTQSEFDDAKAQAVRLFLSSSPSEGGTKADPLYVEDSITSDDTTEEEEEEEEVVNTSELTPALQELLHSEQGSRRDDWISLRNTQFTRAEILDLSASEFRYFILGSKRCSSYMATLFSADSFPVPEALVPDVLRWIRFSNRYELLPKIVREKDTRIALHLLKHHPERFRLSALPSDFVDSDEFGEIFMELCLKDLSAAVGDRWASATWPGFFDLLLRQRSSWEDFGVDEMLIASPNLNESQMVRLVETKVVGTPALAALLLTNVARRGAAFRLRAAAPVLVALAKAVRAHGSAEFKTNLLQLLKTSRLLADARSGSSRGRSGGGGSRSSDSSNDEENLRALNEILAVAGGDGDDFGRKARAALVTNRHLPPASVVGLAAGQPASRSEALFVAAARNGAFTAALAALAQNNNRSSSSSAAASAKIALASSSSFLDYQHHQAASVDTVLTAFLSAQHHNQPLPSAQQRKVLAFIAGNSGNVQAGSIVNCSLALAAVPGLDEDVLKRLSGDRSDIFTKAILARRPDLPNQLRDGFLASSDEEVQIAALAREPRVAVQRSAVRGLLSMRSSSSSAYARRVRDRKLETLASNPTLPAELQRELALSFASSSSSSSSTSWRVHRALAARADFPRDLVPVLLKTKDLDVYTNVARNGRLRLGAETIKGMCSIAGPAVEREEQQLWLPSLRLMHQPSSSSSSSSSSAAAARQQEQNRLLGMLHSYQSQLRMQVLECHSAAVAEDDVSEWVDDPDISVLLAIVTQVPRLSLRLVRDVATSEANAALRADKLSHLAARILRDWAAEAALAPTAATAATMMMTSPSSSSSSSSFSFAAARAPRRSMEAVTAEALEALAVVVAQRDRTVARRLLTSFSASAASAAANRGGAEALVQNERLPAIPGFDPVKFAVHDGLLTAGVLREVMSKHTLHEDIIADVGKVLGALAQRMKEERENVDDDGAAAAAAAAEEQQGTVGSGGKAADGAAKKAPSKPKPKPKPKPKQVLLQGWAELRPLVLSSFRPFNKRFFIVTADGRLLRVTGGPSEGAVDALRSPDAALRAKGLSFSATTLDGATVCTGEAHGLPPEVLEVDAAERKLYVRFPSRAERDRWARTLRALIAGRVDEASAAAAAAAAAADADADASSSSPSSSSAEQSSSEAVAVGVLREAVAAPPRRALTAAEREAAEALVLEFCGNGDVPFELVEPFLETASEAMLQVIFGRLDVPTANIWDLFIRETTVVGYESDRLGMLAARASLPEDLRWTLSLLQSRLGESNLDEVRLQVQQRTTQQQQQQQQRPANKLFNTLLDQESALNCSILNYYLQYEPRESLSLLQSGLLLPSAVKYLRAISNGGGAGAGGGVAEAMPNLVASLNGRFQEFEASARALSGKGDLTFESLPPNVISSACMNRVIRAAVHGVSLRQLPSLIEDTLGLQPREGECDEIAVFLKMMEVLFPRREQEGDDHDDDDDDGEESEPDFGKGGSARGGGGGDGSGGGGDDDDDAAAAAAAADDPGAILVCSVREVRDRLQDFLLSFEWHQWLAEFLDKEWIAFDEGSLALKLKPELPFGEDLDQRLSEKLQGHLKNVLGSRALGRAGGRGSGDEPAASFTVDLLKRVVSSRELTIGQLVAIHRDLGLIGNKNSNGGGGGSGQGGGAFGFLLGNGSAPPPPPTVLSGLHGAGFGEEIVAGGCDRFLDRLAAVAGGPAWANVRKLLRLVDPESATRRQPRSNDGENSNSNSNDGDGDGDGGDDNGDDGNASSATATAESDARHARLLQLDLIFDWQLPYFAVSAFAELFPLRAAEIFPSRVLSLISIWGADDSNATNATATNGAASSASPSSSSASSLSSSSLSPSLEFLNAQLSEILDFVEAGGRELLKGIALHPDILVSAAGSDLTYEHYLDRGSGGDDANGRGRQRRTRQVAPHKCNMRLVAVRAWEALHDAATEVAAGLNDWAGSRTLRFKASLDADDATEVSRVRFNASALSLADLKAAGVFSKDTFRAVGEHSPPPSFPATSEAAEAFSVRAFCRAVRPYRSLLKVDQVFYMHAGSMRNARNAQAFVQLDDFCSEKQLDLSATRILPLFEQAELLLTLQRDVRALHNVSVKKLEAELSKLRRGPSSTSSTPSGDDLDAALDLENGGAGGGAGRRPLLLRDLSVAKELLQGMIEKVAGRGRELARSLAEKADLRILRRPDHENLRDCVVHDTVRMDGHSSMLYPLVLDEATLSPVVDPEDPSCFLRDRARPKQLLPVEFPVKRVVQRPTMVVESGGGRRLDRAGLREALVVNDLHVLAANVSSRLEERMAAVLGTTFSTINRTYLDSEIPAILKVVEEGFTVPLPSLHEVLVVPRARVFRDRLERLAQLPSTLSSHAPDQIATFSFSRRASLPAELTVLAKLLVAARQANASLDSIARSSSSMSASSSSLSLTSSSSSLSSSSAAVAAAAAAERENRVEPAMVRSKWFQLVLAVSVMRSDANYHVILERLQLASSLQRQLGDIVTRILNLEAMKSGGVIMAAFRLNNRGDVIFVSSHYNPSARKWDRWLHYNCNACASLDFGEVESQSPPHDYGDGRRLEGIHCTLFDTTLVLSFSSQCVQRIRMTTHDQVTASLSRGELNDETGVGNHATMSAMSVGRVNWYGNMNHFCKEAALLNASPIMPIGFDENGGIQLLATDESIFRDLQELSETWMKH